MSQLNALVIPGNPFRERLSVWGDMVAGYCTSLQKNLAPRVVVRATFYVSDPHPFLTEFTSELVHSLVQAGIILHPACVVEVAARQLPTGPNKDPERVVINVEQHWTSNESAAMTRWSVA